MGFDGTPGVVGAEPAVKHCACGRSFTRDAWQALPDPRVYSFPWREVHEQRRCPCGSHIVIVLDPGDPEDGQPGDP